MTQVLNVKIRDWVYNTKPESKQTLYLKSLTTR